MDLQDKDIKQLKMLRDFLKQTFKNCSFGPIKIDDMGDSLERAINKLESSNSTKPKRKTE